MFLESMKSQTIFKSQYKSQFVQFMSSFCSLNSVSKLSLIQPELFDSPYWCSLLILSKIQICIEFDGGIRSILSGINMMMRSNSRYATYCIGEAMYHYQSSNLISSLPFSNCRYSQVDFLRMKFYLYNCTLISSLVSVKSFSKEFQFRWQ